jgi:methionyl-tRNA formyltransferase
VIEWSRPAGEIARQVRAFNPWPVAETRWQGQQLRILEAEPRGEGSTAAPGTVVEAANGRLAVATGSGSLEIRRLQLAGRNATSAAEFLNAHQLRGACLG